MKQLAKFLEPLYPNKSQEQREKNLLMMQDEGWQIEINYTDEKEISSCLIYKHCLRMHTGNVIIVDTIMSIDSTGKDLLSSLKWRFGCPIQLDCAIENSKAQKFYYKHDFKIRAFSFLKK